MSSISYNNRTISAPQVGPNFAEQVDAFVDEFDEIINQLLGKVCMSTGQTQEELLRELEEMDISDTDSDTDSDDDGDESSDTDKTDSSGGNVPVEETPSPEMEEDFFLRPLPVSSTTRPMFLLQRRRDAGEGYKEKERKETLRVCLPGMETLRKMMKN